MTKSSTSHEAALGKEESFRQDEAKILALLKAVGERGATDFEIETATGLRQSSASARRNGLVKKGLVRDSGLKRKTRTRRFAIVWILGTGHAVRGSGNERVPRPSPKKIKAALANLDRIMQHSMGHFGPPAEHEVHELLRWLSKLARQQDALDHGVVLHEAKTTEVTEPDPDDAATKHD